MDSIPYGRFIAAIIIGGLTFFMFNLIITEFISLIGFNGEYAGILVLLFSIIPALILFFSGIRLIMIQQKRG